MHPEAFELDNEVLARASDSQRLFAARVQDAIRTLRPSKLDLASVRASIRDGALTIELPHATDPDQSIGATVMRDEAIVHYGVEHEHFSAADAASGRRWPIDAPDFAAAAFRMLEQLLLGKVVLEIRPGWAMQRTRSYLITDSGERHLFLDDGTILLRWRPSEPRLICFDFGARHASSSD